MTEGLICRIFRWLPHCFYCLHCVPQLECPQNPSCLQKTAVSGRPSRRPSTLKVPPALTAHRTSCPDVPLLTLHPALLRLGGCSHPRTGQSDTRLDIECQPSPWLLPMTDVMDSSGVFMTHP
ncbi:hypothetical protein E2C01_004091 [Portunus trituberculatus]|uniref:Uncharacterized protein n=1 Tax=Portunus trituberculatus TaxID=210409 RepID=A0A5B7CQF6_PORTR|nr:hypothetical protein [Portunus trituberculatus]